MALVRRAWEENPNAPASPARSVGHVEPDLTRKVCKRGLIEWLAAKNSRRGVPLAIKIFANQKPYEYVFSQRIGVDKSGGALMGFTIDQGDAHDRSVCVPLNVIAEGLAIHTLAGPTQSSKDPDAERRRRLTRKYRISLGWVRPHSTAPATSDAPTPTRNATRVHLLSANRARASAPITHLSLGADTIVRSHMLS